LILIGYVYSQLGKTEQADKAFTEEIQKLESEVDRDTRNTYLHLSRIYAFMGDKKEALKYLADYAKKGFILGWHDFILIDPFFESLRDDPEFKGIVKLAHEEKAALRAQVREIVERGELNL
jgi:tetratricopeptide (TPR) repeat protein